MRQCLVFLEVVIAVVCAPTAEAMKTPPSVPRPLTTQEIADRDLAEAMGVPQCPGVVQLRENKTYVVINLGVVRSVKQFIHRAGTKGTGFLRLYSVSGHTLDVTTPIREIVEQVKACKKGN